MSLRIITTFNQKMYEASGKELLDSVFEFIPDAQVLAYVDDPVAGDGADFIDLTTLPERAYVLKKFAHLIPETHGGSASELTGFNQRWFGWFQKIIAQYDTLLRRPHEGWTLFLDADVRCIQPIDTRRIDELLDSPVNFMRGDRKAIESGVIAYKSNDQRTRWFIQHFMSLFLSGQFQSLERWDDGFVMTTCAELFSDFAHDMAQDADSVEHINSNGHKTSGQILPVTPLGQYFEHDKGKHWRIGLEAHTADKPTAEAAHNPKPTSRFRQAFQGIWKTRVR